MCTIPASETIVLDGNLDEPIWKNADIANDFVMFEPDNGKPISIEKRTEVKIIYNNEFVYIGALLYDNEPKKILKEITQRDVGKTPEYIVVEETGPDHARVFCIVARVGDTVFESGCGKTKKEAEQRAARNAVEALQRPTPARDAAE